MSCEMLNGIVAEMFHFWPVYYAKFDEAYAKHRALSN